MTLVRPSEDRPSKLGCRDGGERGFGAKMMIDDDDGAGGAHNPDQKILTTARQTGTTHHCRTELAASTLGGTRCNDLLGKLTVLAELAQEGAKPRGAQRAIKAWNNRVALHADLKRAILSG